MNKEFESLLNKNLKEFVDKYVTSFVCWDLSNLFSRNTGLVDSVEGIVSRLGRKEEVSPVLSLAKIYLFTL